MICIRWGGSPVVERASTPAHKSWLQVKQYSFALLFESMKRFIPVGSNLAGVVVVFKCRKNGLVGEKRVDFLHVEVASVEKLKSRGDQDAGFRGVEDVAIGDHDLHPVARCACVGIRSQRSEAGRYESHA